jgi:hypothetical protein
MAVKLSPFFNDAQLDSNGDPAVGWTITPYVAGSTTPQATYQDAAGNSSHQHPITLNARGEPPAPIWLTAGVTYDLVLKNSSGSIIRTVEDVSGVNDTTTTIDEWVTGPAPTYVSATSFTVAGDQTSTFTARRRLKSTNTAGTIYSTVTSSAYGASTTVTVVNDSGTLDSGLSAVSYGLVNPAYSSIPVVADTTAIVKGSADVTKQLKIEVDGLTTNTTRTWTAPDANLTVVGVDTTQTLTAKTLTSPVLNSPTINTPTMGGTTLTHGNVSGLLLQGTTEEVSATIPSWVKRITVQIVGMSTDGTSIPIIQIGDSGGYETTGYNGAVGGFSGSTLGTGLNYANAAINNLGFGLAHTWSSSMVASAIIVIEALDAGSNTWVVSGQIGRTDAAAMMWTVGNKTLTGTLDRLRLTTVNGTDAYDGGGSVNIIYE